MPTLTRQCVAQYRVVSSTSQSGDASVSQISGDLSHSVRISAPKIMRDAPSTGLPVPPVRPSFWRMAAMAEADMRPISAKGAAAPIPNASMTKLTWPRFSPWAASSEAAPKVGPTHGSQTRPSIAPSRAYPPAPLSLK